jgi:GH15 family glucan-1,4-alpha-glucosidase
MLWVAIDRGMLARYILLASSVRLRPPGLRLADKRSLPCPKRFEWLAARDELFEDIMNQAWNPEERFFAQSYEDKDIVDSAVLIMPLVFFIPAVRSFLALSEPNLTFPSQTEPRFLSTLERILKSPVHGGLTSNVRTMVTSDIHASLTVSSQNLVFRYDVTKADDGVGGEEGTFSLCTLWCVSIRIPSCGSPMALA